MKSSLRTCVLVAACVAVAGLCAPASAGIKYWDPITNGGGTSDWMNPNNWNEGGVGPGVP